MYPVRKFFVMELVTVLLTLMFGYLVVVFGFIAFYPLPVYFSDQVMVSSTEGTFRELEAAFPEACPIRCHYHILLQESDIVFEIEETDYFLIDEFRADFPAGSAKGLTIYSFGGGVFENGVRYRTIYQIEAGDKTYIAPGFIDHHNQLIVRNILILAGLGFGFLASATGAVAIFFVIRKKERRLAKQG